MTNKIFNHLKKKEHEIFTEFWQKKFFQCMNEASMIKMNSFDETYGIPISIIPHEKPDVLVLFEKNILMLEHFRFDSSKSKKNSSLLQGESVGFYKNEKPGFVIKKIENEASIDWYKDNLIRVTNNHLLKYNSYLENVAENEGLP